MQYLLLRVPAGLTYIVWRFTEGRFFFKVMVPILWQSVGYQMRLVQTLRITNCESYSKNVVHKIAIIMRYLDRRHTRPDDRGIEGRRRIGGEIFVLETKHCDQNTRCELICMLYHWRFLDTLFMMMGDVSV